MQDDRWKWLRGVIEDDKKVAQLAHGLNPAPWAPSIGELWGNAVVTDADGNPLWDDEGSESLEMEGPVGLHVARHDPQDIVARCGQELKLLDELEASCTMAYGGPNHQCTGLGRAAQILLQGYRHRHGWQEEWAD